MAIGACGEVGGGEHGGEVRGEKHGGELGAMIMVVGVHNLA